jgi:rhamnosyltransferase
MGEFYQIYPYNHWPLDMQMFSCVCMAISREAWLKTGFGDVPMSEDKLLAVKALERGLKWRLASAKVLHGHNYSLSGLVKRSFNEGMGAQQTHGRFGARELFTELFRIRRYRTTLWGLRTGRIRSMAELLFPILRPLALWVGYRFGRKYWY